MVSVASFLRRHVRSVVGTGAVVAILAGGGVAYAATASGGPAAGHAPSAAVSPVAVSGSAASSSTARRFRIARGTITDISGSTWTVRTARGQSISVTITSRTRFGTKAAPASASSFKVGSVVNITGRRTGATSITARHIWTPRTNRSARSASTIVTA